MPGRLSDTEALVRVGINPPGAKVAPVRMGDCGADNVGPQPPGQFRRETGAGAEGLSGAKKELGK